MKRPEKVFQLEAPGLSEQFPALRNDTGGGVPLPTYPTSFVGRVAEQAEIGQLLKDSDGRLVTLLGTGGIGKTRLAVETARGLAAELAGGAFFVDLTRITNIEDVGLAISEAVGAHPEGTASTVALAAARITRPTLLVLDNFEHVQAAATTVAELLNVNAHVRLIATSRAPLHIRSERILRIEPLPSLNGNGSVPPAVALFYERASGHGVELGESGPESEAVRSIVGRLDGLPLAIELAAARTRLLGVAELERMLSESLDALGSGAADLPERQRTIRSTIEWSLQSLTSRQRELFAHLSVFPAGATLSQVERVVDPALAGAVFDELEVLVDNSLVDVDTGQSGGTRYRQLTLLRDYGAELLEKSGETDLVMGRLVDYYVAAAPELARSLQESLTSEKDIRADHANLAAAMAWSLDHDRIAEMVDVVCHIWVYWFNGDRAGSAAQWVSMADPASDSAKLDWLVGFFAFQGGDYETAVTRMARAIESFQDAGDTQWEAMSQVFAAPLIDDLDASREMLEAALDNFETNGLEIEAFLSKLFLSHNALARGEAERALRMRKELLAGMKSKGIAVLVAWSEMNLALALIAVGRIDEADEHNRRALAYMVSDGYQEGIASSADLVAVVQFHRGEADRALRLIGASQSVLDALGVDRWPEATIVVETMLAQARNDLGDAECERLLSEGRALSLSALIELMTSQHAGQSNRDEL